MTPEGRSGRDSRRASGRESARAGAPSSSSNSSSPSSCSTAIICAAALWVNDSAAAAWSKNAACRSRLPLCGAGGAARANGCATWKERRGRCMATGERAWSGGPAAATTTLEAATATLDRVATARSSDAAVSGKSAATRACGGGGGDDSGGVSLPSSDVLSIDARSCFWKRLTSSSLCSAMTDCCLAMAWHLSVSSARSGPRSLFCKDRMAAACAACSAARSDDFRGLSTASSSPAPTAPALFRMTPRVARYRTSKRSISSETAAWACMAAIIACPEEHRSPTSKTAPTNLTCSSSGQTNRLFFVANASPASPAVSPSSLRFRMVPREPSCVRIRSPGRAFGRRRARPGESPTQ
mmetsp:Transcript_29186/g.100748  ORF Transcript_29186/g.100748 Transcript_29186/m.100748 type:complete len:354 (+) Transcript_29186:441-1502(+)